MKSGTIGQDGWRLCKVKLSSCKVIVGTKCAGLSKVKQLATVCPDHIKVMVSIRCAGGLCAVS